MDKHFDAHALAAEAKTLDDDVQRPGRSQAGSAVSNLVRLKEGQTFVLNKEISLSGLTERQRVEQVNELKRKLRQTASGAITRAKTVVPSNNYSMESNVITSGNARVFACVFITCTSENQDDEL